MKYARIIDNIVVEVIANNPNEIFHSSIAEQFTEVPDDVTPESKLDPETGKWTINVGHINPSAIRAQVVDVNEEIVGIGTTAQLKEGEV